MQVPVPSPSEAADNLGGLRSLLGNQREKVSQSDDQLIGYVHTTARLASAGHNGQASGTR
jgi:hypothetical protein